MKCFACLQDRVAVVRGYEDAGHVRPILIQSGKQVGDIASPLKHIFFPSMNLFHLIPFVHMKCCIRVIIGQAVTRDSWTKHLQVQVASKKKT